MTHSTGKPDARLVLEDGKVFEGYGFGAETTALGEVVFHTAMSGYQEMLTDPSYAAQILVLTAVEIGAVGTNPDDDEASVVFPTALVVRDYVEASNFRSRESLDAYLKRHGVIGIAGVDTRALTLHLRQGGVLRGVVCRDPQLSCDDLVSRARQEPAMAGRDLASEVGTKERYLYVPSTSPVLPGDVAIVPPGNGPHVVAFDFGLKRSMLQFLAEAGARITVVPPRTSAQEVLALSADAVFLTNGPGDPAAVGYAIETIRALLGKLPIFGICLGHQLLALAVGATTSKMKFGHRGANQPVRELATGKLQITAQNHGFAVDSTLPNEVRVTHENLNDGSVEGIEIVGARAKSVQFHPEASPGPLDARSLFGDFLRL